MSLLYPQLPTWDDILCTNNKDNYLNWKMTNKEVRKNGRLFSLELNVIHMWENVCEWINS